MKEEILRDALLSALSLLNNEIQTLEIDLLKEEYSEVIEKLENALILLK